jgi:VWFA-related protein
MKYTGRYFFLGVIFLTVAVRPALSQSAYAVPPSMAAASPANSEVDSSSDPVLTIKKRVSEVNVLFIATDKHGKFVRNLGQNDFTILDDHKPPQAIVNFRRETDLPMQLGLLIDTSGSVNSRFAFEQQASISFFQHMIRPNFDSAFVMGFNSHTRVAQDFTDNVRLLETAVHKLEAGGGTALYDAIYRACRDKLNSERPDHPVRRAIVVVSDGADNQSDVGRGQAIEMAQRAEVIIYAISTDDGPVMTRGDKALEQLAVATGGRVFFPSKMKDITHAFSSIEEELRSQYVVSYRPADFMADGRFRSIEITASKKDLEVRARQGYYAPRQ